MIELLIMSKETAARMGLTESILHHVSPERRGKILRGGIERVLCTTPYEFPPDFKEKIQEALLKGPVVIAQNHKSNADILAGAIVAATIVQISNNKKIPENRKIKGFVEPFALSLDTGGQGQMSTFYYDTLPLLAKLKVEPVPTPTANDVLRGRITPEQFEEYHTGSKMRMALAVMKHQKSIIFAPEASVKSGRINPETGKIYGMQEFTPGALHGVLRIATRRTGYASLLLIGVSDGEKVLDSETNKITPRATAVGFGLSFQAIMSVHIGEMIGITNNEVEALDTASLDLRAGRGIAQLLKPEEQGVFAIAA